MTTQSIHRKVFLTWSGHRSKAVARALKEWLPNVIQVLEPWMSEDDIDKGAKWASEISGQLEQTKFGIVCLTPENLTAPWVNFEAGALSKLADSYVCTLLHDLSPTDVRFPLAQFQHTETTEPDIKRLLETINKKLGDQALKDPNLNEAFNMWWPKLKAELDKVPPASGDVKRPNRDIQDLLEEILSICREQDNKSNTTNTMLQALTQLKLPVALDHFGSVTLTPPTGMVTTGTTYQGLLNSWPSYSQTAWMKVAAQQAAQENQPTEPSKQDEQK